MLLVDGVPQSHVDLDDPGYLDFEYVRRLGHVIDEAAPAGQPLRVLHLGAGALTLARYVAATRPGSSQLAVEVDAALVDLIRLRLPPRNPRLRIRVGDAQVRAGAAAAGLVRRGDRGRVRRGTYPGPPDLGGILGRGPAGGARRGRVRGAGAVRGAGVVAANVADGRAAGAHPGPGRDRADGVPARLPDRGRRGAARPEVRQPGAGGRARNRCRSTRSPAWSAGDPMPGRVLSGRDLDRFTAGAKPVTDATAAPSPAAPPGAFAF